MQANDLNENLPSVVTIESDGRHLTDAYGGGYITVISGKQNSLTSWHFCIR